MTLAVTIGGSARRIEGLRITKALDSRALCNFSLDDLDASTRPTVGQAVVAAWSGDTQFGGQITGYRESRLARGSTGLRYGISCVDYFRRLDDFLCGSSHSNKTAGQVIRDLLSTHVPAAEGFTTTSVEDGPTIGVMNFPRKVRVSDACREVARRVGYAVWVDQDKDVHFQARTSVAAPISLVDGGTNFYGLVLEKSLEDYRNRQWIEGGMARTATQTDEAPKAPTPDGTARRFFFRFPIAQEPVVKLDGATQTIGVHQVDADKQWYWLQKQDWILQDSSEVAVQAGSTLGLTYVGLYPIVVRADDEGEQAARAAAEGNSGIYEAIDERPSIEDKDEAIDETEALLRRYASLPATVTFKTTSTGLEPGQLLPINLTAHGLAGSYLIRKLELRLLASDQLESTVECLSGEETGRWVDYFRNIVTKLNRPSIRENEVVQRVQRIVDGVSCGDTLTVTDAAPESRIGTMQIGYGEIA